MPETSALYASAVANTRSTRLINHERVLRMIDSKTPADALKVLYEVNFGDGENVSNAYDFEKIISAEERSLLKFIEEYSPSKELVRLFELPYRYNNLKAVFKAKYGNQSNLEQAFFAFSNETQEELREKVFADNYEELGEFAASAASAVDNLKVSGQLSPRKIDSLFDCAMYSESAALLKKLHFENLKKYYRLKADSVNFETFARCKNAGFNFKQFSETFVTGGNVSEEMFSHLYENSLESLAEAFRYTEQNELSRALVDSYCGNAPLYKYEVYVDNALLSVFKSEKYMQDGLDGFLAYIIAKQSEIKNVRIVMVSLLNGFDKQNIMERLRELYV